MDRSGIEDNGQNRKLGFNNLAYVATKMKRGGGLAAKIQRKQRCGRRRVSSHFVRK